MSAPDDQTSCVFFYEKMDFSQVVFMTKGFLAFHELTPQLEERILDIPNLKSLVLSTML